MTRIIGSHTVDNGGIDMAARRAAAAGMNAVQIFTAIPKFYNDKSSIRPERVERFRAALEELRMPPKHVMVHAAYVLNVATADRAKWARAAAGLRREMERSTTLGVGQVCFHPGSAGSGDVAASAARVARAMRQALDAVDGAVRLLVENTAGAGSTIGRTPEQVGAILDHLDGPYRARAGYGLDTCHLFASGYDITESAATFGGVLDAFEGACGEAPAFFHLNDSAGELGSNRDRHTLIGEGRIGAGPFRWLLEDKRSRRVPLILETPQKDMEIAKDDARADPYDVRMMDVLGPWL
ncbi:MAG: deoxyribonuclease IV [Longimicrobiales bacterium]